MGNITGTLNSTEHTVGQDKWCAIHNAASWTDGCI